MSNKGSSKHSWRPVMTVDTTTRTYWLNWRVALCSIWISSCILVASVLIWKFEVYKKSRTNSEEETQQESEGTLYEDEAWKPCLKEIHPAWLLAYRVTAFILLLALLIVNVFVDGGTVFYFYTQWTFTLVTIYFGLGSLLSVYGCNQYRNRVSGDRMASDAEQGMRNEENANASNFDKNSAPQEQRLVRKTAGTWSYIFQVIFQMNAGAVLLTDFVFWFVMFPFLAIKDYNYLNFLLIGMHSINAIFLVGETALNCLRFPWFRIAYFMLWTSVFVIFEWVLHACLSTGWPYPFLDLSSSYSPGWYVLVGLLHVPCYAIFGFIIKMKHKLWSRWFPHSYQCRR